MRLLHTQGIWILHLKIVKVMETDQIQIVNTFKLGIFLNGKYKSV